MNLIDPTWLLANLGRSDLILADVRWFLGAPARGLAEYREGHIPGAHFVDLDRDLASAASVPGGRHPLPSVESFAKLLERLGAQAGDRIVAYDVQSGAIAARLWWLLRYFQAPVHASVLDGGLAGYSAAGGKQNRLVPEAKSATTMPLKASPEMVADSDAAAQASARGALLLDARSAQRYRGEVEPVDPRAGHIPGAKNRPWGDNLDGGRFRPPELLKRDFKTLGVADDRDTICYCGSGVTACHNVLALEQAGVRNVRLYVGSWSDWSSRTERPLATGDDSTS